MRHLHFFANRIRALLLALLLGLMGPVTWAQSCGPNAAAVTFNFSTTTSNNANGGTATWTDSSVGPASRIVGLATSGTANTLTFAMDKLAAAVWASPANGVAIAPVQYTTGNMANSLLLAMDNPSSGNWTGMTVSFARPMSTVSFVMGDVDYSNSGGSNFQDQFEVTGYSGGIAVTSPVMVPNVPASYTTATIGGITAQITRNVGTASCGNTETTCNVTVNFSQPIDQFRIRFVSGPAIAAPTLQYVGFDNYSFCVPNKPDLKLTKTATTTTFVAGQTGTYTLTITNVGGTPTTGNYTVTDVIATTGVTFPSPQSPGGGWTCTIGTTNFTSDSASCVRSTALAVNGTATLTLTVVVSADNAATTVTNRAKAFGGNDPNKTLLTSTGALASCSAANEGLSGGGANAGCAYENTTISKQANLTISKTNNVSTLAAGSTTSYTVTLSNLGPSSANNALIKDSPTSGLNCTTVTCVTATGGASCPAGLAPLGTAIAWASIPNLSNGTGIGVTTFPSNGSIQLTIGCNVTATGS